MQTQEEAPSPELPPRRVAQSRVETVRIMSKLDANSLGNVHGGVIMREVDNVAGLAAARHSGRVAVTAAIDELSFLQPVFVGDLLVVAGQRHAQRLADDGVRSLLGKELRREGLGDHDGVGAVERRCRIASEERKAIEDHEEGRVRVVAFLAKGEVAA